MRLSDENLRGLTVISADGTAIGSIAELFISSSDWRVESIRVELRKDVADRIGADRTMFHRHGRVACELRPVRERCRRAHDRRRQAARSAPPACDRRSVSAQHLI